MGAARATPILPKFFVDRHKDDLEFNGGYLDVSPNYNPIDGYTSNSDIRGPQFYANATGATPAIKNYIVLFETDRFLDDSGAVHQADTQVFLNATFKNLFSFDGVGEAVGQLRSYGIPAGPGCSGPILYQSSFTGYPCYRDGVTQPFNLYQVPIGYRDGTPVTGRCKLSVGTVRRQLRPSVYDRHEPARSPDASASGWNTTERTSAHSPMASSTRSGCGAFRWATTSRMRAASASNFATSTASAASPHQTQIGNNLAVAFHQRFQTGNELYVNFGSPASGATLNRLIVKFVLHEGADEGT